MSEDSPSQESHDPRLDRILAEILEAAEHGQDVAPESWIARYPEFAEELREFCASRQQLNDLFSPDTAPESEFPESDDQTLMRGDASPGAADNGTVSVRYFGEYQLLEEIARGGMGVVYKARQTTLKRIVALKMILSGKLAGEEEVKRFHAEAEAAAKLDHPNIVPIFEVGQHEGQHYFSMAFVEGESLARKVVAGPLPSREAAQLIRKVTEAVGYAHIEGVVHRDLKPANVLLDSDGEPRVTDFGLAKRISAEPLDPEAEESAANLTGTGQILGTPNYMPPEQATGKSDEVGPLSDVYSLGAMLYCLLTGRPPFQAASPIDALMQVLEKDPVPVRQLDPNVSRDLETICMKCLEKDPRRRYGSAGELADDLGRHLDGRPILARPASRAERTVKWVRRQPATAALIATTIVALLSLVATGVGLAYADQLELALDDATEQRAEADRQRGEATEQRDEADSQRRLAETLQQQAESLERGSRYASEVNMAHSAWQDGHFDRSLELLDRWNPGDDAGGEDLRGWEWDYVHRLSQAELLTLRGHRGHVPALTFTEDGRRLVSVDGKGTVRWWSAWGGGEVASVATGMQGVKLGTTRFSADGTRVFITYDEPAGNTPLTITRIGVWDAGAGERLITLPAEDEETRETSTSDNDGEFVEVMLPLERNQIKAATLSPDGRRLAVVRAPGSWSGEHPGTALQLYDVDTGERTLEIETAAGTGLLVFDAKGERLAGSTSWADRMNVIQIWDVATGERLVEMRQPEGCGRMAFSPDGKRLLCVNVDVRNFLFFGPGTVKFWDTETGRGLLELGQITSPIYDVAFSPDGRRIALADANGVVRILNGSGQEVARFRAPADGVTAVAFSPDGKRLACAGFHGAVERTDEPADVLIWDVTAEQDQRVVPLEGTGYRVAFAPDGRRLAVVDYGAGGIVILDAVTGRTLHTLLGHEVSVTNVDFSRDGRYLASASGNLVKWSDDDEPPAEVKLWDTDTHQLVRTFDGHPVGVDAVALSPDDRFLATGCRDKLVRIFDVESGELVRTLTGHTDAVSALEFAPDGRRLASAGENDPTIRVWDTGNGEQLFVLDHPEVDLAADMDRAPCLAFGPDGNLLATSHGEQFQATIYERLRGKPGEIRIWDARTGELLRTLRGHVNRVMAVAFTPDGRRLASAGQDGTIKIWDPRTGRDVFTLPGPRPLVHDIAFGPDGWRLAVVGGDIPGATAQCRIWDATPRDGGDEDAHRLAQTLLGSLFESGWVREEILERLAADTDLPESLRETAVRLAQSQEADENWLNNAAWDVVKHADRDLGNYRLALRQIEASLQLDPDDLYALNTLGVAQYRAGLYAEALATLERSCEARAESETYSQAYDLAFIAMARHRLGQTDAARADLARLGEILVAADRENRNTADLREFQHEAETLIHAAAASPGE